MISLSDTTRDILKNFSSINKSIVIEPGNKVSTISVNKNILATAKIEENFSDQVSIYDLSAFLGAVSLFDSPHLVTDDKKVKIRNSKGSYSSTFYYADPEIIVRPPQKEINFPSEFVSFKLPATLLNRVFKAASLFQVPDMCIFTKEGKVMMSVTDKKNETSNSFEAEVGEDDRDFCFCFKVENLKILEVDYNVTISEMKVAKFTNADNSLEYLIALEPDSNS